MAITAGTLINKVANELIGQDADTTTRPTIATLLGLADKYQKNICRDQDFTFLRQKAVIEEYTPSTDADANIAQPLFNTELYSPTEDAGIVFNSLMSEASIALKLVITQPTYINKIVFPIKRSVSSPDDIDGFAYIVEDAETKDGAGQYVPPTIDGVGWSVLATYTNEDIGDISATEYTNVEFSGTTTRIAAGTYWLVFKFTNIGYSNPALVFEQYALPSGATYYMVNADQPDASGWHGGLSNTFYIELSLANIDYSEPIILSANVRTVRSMVYGADSDNALKEIPNRIIDSRGAEYLNTFFNYGFDTGRLQIKANPAFTPTTFPEINCYVYPTEITAIGSTFSIPDGYLDLIEDKIILKGILKGWALQDTDEVTEIQMRISQTESQLRKDFIPSGAYSMAPADADNVRDFTFGTGE